MNDMNKNIIKLILIWMFFWLLYSGGSTYFLRPINADQLHHYYITTSYFYLAAIFGIVYYEIKDTLDTNASVSKQIVIIIFSTFFLASLCRLIDHFFPLSEFHYEKIMKEGFYFPLFKYQTITTKIADISYQQIFIFSLIKKLKESCVENRKIIIYFSISFFIVHLPLVVVMGWLAFYFIIPSIFAGFLFSYLIINKKYGPSISFTLHFLFYILIGTYLRY